MCYLKLRLQTVLYVTWFACAIGDPCYSQSPSIEGRWRIVDRFRDGKKVTLGSTVVRTFTFSQGEIDGGLLPPRFETDETTEPKGITLYSLVPTSIKRGIYKVDRDTLTICIAEDPASKATTFETRGQPGVTKTVYERISEDVDPDALLLTGSWQVKGKVQRHFPFRFLEKVEFSSPPFENTVYGSIIGWKGYRRGEAESVAHVRVRLDSKQQPKKISMHFSTRAGKSNVSMEMAGEYQLKDDIFQFVVQTVDPRVDGMHRWQLQLVKQ